MTATTAQPKADPQLDELCVNTIRTLAMDAVQKANSGHPGTPMALAPIAYVLYTRVMRHAPEHPDWPDRDRFVLSAGHASMLLYSMLHLTGYGLSLDDIKNFRQLGLARAPATRSTATRRASRRPPARSARASRCAVGIALGERMLNARFGDDVIDHHTFVIASDGDMQEGISGEAGVARRPPRARPPRSPSTTTTTSRSRATPRSSFSEDVGKRFEAYGWHVQNLGEDLAPRPHRAGHARRDGRRGPAVADHRAHAHRARARRTSRTPTAAHGSPLGEEEVRLTKEAYGWDRRRAVLRPRRGARALPRVRSSAATSCIDEWRAALRRLVGLRDARRLGRRRADVLAARRRR